MKTKKEMEALIAGMVKLLKYLMVNSDKQPGRRSTEMERQYQIAKRLVARAEQKS